MHGCLAAHTEVFQWLLRQTFEQLFQDEERGGILSQWTRQLVTAEAEGNRSSLKTRFSRHKKPFTIR